MIERVESATSAVLLIDLQNDYLHERGAYARGGIRLSSHGLLDRASETVRAARAAGVLVVSVNYTVPYGREKIPLFRSEFKERYPFLRAGDFAPGSWGHETVSELLPDMVVEKVFPSGFVQSRLELQLKLSGITTVFICGITTNNGVAATFYDSRRLGFQTAVLGDCCAAKNTQVHEASLLAMGSISSHSPVINSKSFIASLQLT